MTDQYSVRTAKNGRILYFKNNRLVKKADIPEGTAIRDMDFELETVDQPTPTKATIEPEAKAAKVCLFGDGPGDFVRFVNLQYVYLCDDHYHNATLGRIVQELRSPAINESYKSQS